MDKLGKKGFTLVELAIVMVIIGLLIGAVIKGQAMIDNARQKRLLNDIQGISAAYFAYYDRYNAVPGDDTSTHGWAGVTAGNGNGILQGNPNLPNGESQEAWQALRYAGLLTGDPTTTGAPSLPRTPFGDNYGLASMSFGPSIGTRNYILLDNIIGSVGEVIDIKHDDGLWDSGTVRASAVYTNTTVDLRFAL